MDKRENVIYISEGVVTAPREAIANFFDYSGFASDAELFMVDGINGLSKGEAATFYGAAFTNAEDCAKAWDTLDQGQLNESWEWDCDGVVYVPEENDTVCIMASAINGGFKMTPQRLAYIYSKMEKIS